MPIGLIALALGGFGIGLTEFGIVGLLPEIAREFAVSESAAGYLVSGYALSVALGALLLTAALARFERKTVLVGLMVLFIAGNLVSALAPTYGILLGGRIIAALCHGAFFSVGAVVASEMVAANKRGSAVALMFGGLTAANVLGVPLGTFLGQQLGWRSTFWAITVIGVVALLGIQALVPRTAAAAGGSLRAELAVFRRGQVWYSIVLGVLAFGSVVGAYTYIAFTLTEVTGFAATAVPWLLVLFGVGTFVGNYFGGKAADKSLDRSLMLFLAVLTVVLAVFALTAQSKVATVVALLLMGTIGLAAAPGLQVRGMKYAQDAPSMASGATIAAFNIGNALGAWIGGLTLAAGLGFVSPLWVGAALALVGLAVAAAAGASARRAEPTAAAQAPVGVAASEIR
ncbi:MFS transporter [Actinokineospora globicatena]|uniref:MFS transporter n=1 Tax=Actinokineospora globicatena TaxID=103729 RepID=UPI0020A54034|nr:MFS transporter [Actinokineospora globicatena]MCP2305946.1 MFS transporter, DHA1 family, arabinose polymer transporter [Actinokineospora globicatena]GLW80184.1 MFS transporter [Actinokineospora globicatena]GLW87013.1 MFS transporter [Actinokineospora globicatena]